MSYDFSFDNNNTDLFKDSETVSTRSTMQSTDSSRSGRSRENSGGAAPPSRGNLQRKNSSRRLRTSRDLHKQERAQQQHAQHQPEEEAFDAFGFSQDSAFGEQSFEPPPQRSAAAPRSAPRTRRRASLAAAAPPPPAVAAAAVNNSRNPPMQSHSFDGSDLPSARRGADPNRPTRRGRRASLAAAPPNNPAAPQEQQSDYGYGDGTPNPASDYGYGSSSGGEDGNSSNEFGYGDGAPSNQAPSPPTASATPDRPRRGRRSSISGGLEGLKSNLKHSTPDPFASSSGGSGGDGIGAGSSAVGAGGAGSGDRPGMPTSSARQLGGSSRSQNIVLPMAAPEKARRSGRRGSLLGSVGDVVGAVGATVGGLAHAIGKEKLDDDNHNQPKQKSFLKDRGVQRQSSADGSIISSYTGDRDRRRRQSTAGGSSRGKGEGASSYSDRIMAKK